MYTWNGSLILAMCAYWNHFPTKRSLLSASLLHTQGACTALCCTLPLPVVCFCPVLLSL